MARGRRRKSRDSNDAECNVDVDVTMETLLLAVHSNSHLTMSHFKSWHLGSPNSKAGYICDRLQTRDSITYRDPRSSKGAYTEVNHHASVASSFLSSTEAFFMSSATSSAASFSWASSDRSPLEPVSLDATFFPRPSRRLESPLGDVDKVEASNASFSRRSTSFCAAAIF